jgi:hypothetical protein
MDSTASHQAPELDTIRRLLDHRRRRTPNAPCLLARAALRLYQPQFYDRRVVHFSALYRSSGSFGQLKMEWRPVTRGLSTFHEIEGDHNTIWIRPTCSTWRGFQPSSCARTTSR